MISFTQSRLYKDIGSKAFFTMATLLMPLLENGNSLDILLSYFGLVDARISDSDKYLPTHTIYSTFYSRD